MSNFLNGPGAAIFNSLKRGGNYASENQPWNPAARLASGNPGLTGGQGDQILAGLLRRMGPSPQGPTQGPAPGPQAPGADPNAPPDFGPNMMVYPPTGNFRPVAPNGGAMHQGGLANMVGNALIPNTMKAAGKGGGL